MVSVVNILVVQVIADTAIGQMRVIMFVRVNSKRLRSARPE